jgi:phosphotriesterase-related protein
MTHLQTVLGPVDVNDLGLILPHEHLFIGGTDADEVDPNDVLRLMGPYLDLAQGAGVTALIECTPTGMQNPEVLVALGKSHPIAIVMPVGLYKNAFPSDKLALSDAELTDWMVREIEEGIGVTDVRAGFIKMAVTDEGITDIESRNLRVAARAARETGVIVASHTSGPLSGKHALEQLDILASQGLPGEQFNWVHAQHADVAYHQQAARRGAYVGFDGMEPAQEEHYVKLVLHALDAGLEAHILLSHDAGWYRGGEPDGGANQVRGFTYLIDGFLPRLRREGVSEELIALMTEANPKRAFRVRADYVRKS